MKQDDVELVALLEPRVRALSESARLGLTVLRGVKVTSAALAMVLAKELMRLLHERRGKAPTAPELATMLRDMPWEVFAIGALAIARDDCKGEGHT